MAFLTVRAPGLPPVPESIRTVFAGFTDKFEGKLSWMYLDSIGLVTTARGNLIDLSASGFPDPAAPAVRLPWLDKAGHAADPATIRATWSKVKAMQSMRGRGGYAFATYSDLRLSATAIDDLLMSELHRFWDESCRRFVWLPNAPADAQLGIMSMCWAMGSGFDFPKFEAAAARGDWTTCAAECAATRPPVPAARNAANHTLFANAAKARDRAALYWPVAL